MKINYLQILGLSLDNTSVNMGKHNSIQSHALVKNPSVYIMGCPCHIMHNAAHKADSAFQCVSNDVKLIVMCSSTHVFLSYRKQDLIVRIC